MNSDPYQIELFRAREGPLNRRRPPITATRMADMEKPPDVVAFWRVIRKRRWTVLMAFGVLFWRRFRRNHEAEAGLPLQGIDRN